MSQRAGEWLTYLSRVIFVGSVPVLGHLGAVGVGPNTVPGGIVIGLAAAVPDLLVVIAHLGASRRRDGVMNVDGALDGYLGYG